MKIGPRYKRARYLGAPVFHKTQTQKYALRAQRKTKTTRGGRGGKSEYGKQMMEKQKARFSYGISSKQFGNYVEAALKSSGDNGKNLLRILESRLDNVVLRAGFAPSRSAARQMVSHGHICVNGHKITIPSYQVKVGDAVTIRDGSKDKVIFRNLDETWKGMQWPSWLKVNTDTRSLKIEAEPVADQNELLFDLQAVLQYYTR